MTSRAALAAALAGTLAAAPMTGCKSAPGTKGQQGAVIGGAGGALVGAAVGGNNAILGALLGGALGAGGGYLVGVDMDKAATDDRAGAQSSIQRAQSSPATAAEARAATTADINGDGFVTMDEVIAMERAGFSDDEMLRRLRATNQVFALSVEQQDYLVSYGVSRRVVSEMDAINRDMRDELLAEEQVIGQPL